MISPPPKNPCARRVSVRPGERLLVIMPSLLTRWWAHYRSIRVFDVFDDFQFFAPDFGSIIRVGQYCRTCFEPLAIYAMSFRPFRHFDDLRCFLWNSGCLLTYIRLIATSMDYLCIPHTIVTPIRCVTDILWLCFDFITLEILIFDVSIIYSFGWLYHYYSFRLCPCSIPSLQMPFDLSEVIFTYIYIPLSFTQK